jgi:hypothetical protein
VRFGLQATLSMLQHGFRHFSGDPGKPGEKVVDSCAAFKIFEQRLNGDSRTAKYPGAANSIRIALHSGARRPIQHCLRLARFHSIDKFAIYARAKTGFGVTSYMGADIPGKPRFFMPYIGGVGRCQRVCDEIVAERYKGFRFQAKSTALGRRQAI